MKLSAPMRGGVDTQTSSKRHETYRCAKWRKGNDDAEAPSPFLGQTEVRRAHVASVNLNILDILIEAEQAQRRCSHCGTFRRRRRFAVRFATNPSLSPPQDGLAGSARRRPAPRRGPIRQRRRSPILAGSLTSAVSLSRWSSPRAQPCSGLPPFFEVVWERS